MSSANQLACYQSCPAVNNLESYIRWVHRIPMLSADEERELTERFFKTQDLSVAGNLVMAHLRYVVKVARGYKGYGLSQEDLIQEGNMGLMKAVKHFKPGMGTRLVTFAMSWINAAMYEFVIRNWRIVKIATTKAQRKLFFNLRKLSRVILQKEPYISSRELVKKIAKKLDVKQEEVSTMMMRMQSIDLSISTTIDNEAECSGASIPEDRLINKEIDPSILLEQQDWSTVHTTNLYKALAKLDARSRDIVKKRWLAGDEKKTTLQVLADQYGISAERVRQLEKYALSKLRDVMMDSGHPV